MQNHIKLFTLISFLLLCFSFFSCNETTPVYEKNYIESISPKDDFYTATNKEWMLNHLDLSLTKYSYSAEQELVDNVNKQISDIFTNLHTKQTKTAKEDIIYNLYNSAIDFETRNQQGIAPIQDYLDSLYNASSLEELLNVDFQILSKFGFSTLYSLDSDYLFNFLAKDFSKSFALGNNATRLKRGLEKLLKLANFPAEEAKNIATLSCELYQTVGKQMVTLPGYEANAIPTSINLSNLEKQLPFLDFTKIFNTYGFPKQSVLYVKDLSLFETTIPLFTEENFAQIKARAITILLLNCAQHISEDFFRTYYEINAILQGTSVPYINEQTKQEIAISRCSNDIHPLIEEFYINKYCAKDTKDSISALAHSIIDQYKNIVTNTNLLNNNLKNIATKKLENISLNIAYPEKLLDFIDISTYPKNDTYVEKVFHLFKQENRWKANNNTKLEPEKVWREKTYTVNAYYYPQDNSFTICAGLLQTPYYAENLTEEELLGSIGMIIAHEIGHAFDSNFINYNHLGNFSYAWTEESLANYKEWTAQILENYTCKDFCKFQNNGETTLAENISDILAMQCCLEILKTKENPNYQAFFESFAKVHRFTGVESFISYRFSQDIHSMPRTRVNKTVANFQEFYDTYNIKKNHAMYINPSKRIKF